MNPASLYTLAHEIIKCPVTNTTKIKETLIEYVNELSYLLQPPFFVHPKVDHNFKLIQIIIEDKTKCVARLVFSDSEHLIIAPTPEKGVVYGLFEKEAITTLENTGAELIKQNDYNIIKNLHNTVIKGVESIHDYLLKWKSVYGSGLINNSLNKAELVLSLYEQLNSDEMQEKSH